VGLQAPKSPKLVIFGINLPLKRFFYTKFGMGRDSHSRTLVPNLTIVTFKMWSYSLKKITEIGNFGINCKIWIGERVPGPYLHAKFHRSGFKMSAYSLNMAKNRNFWYKFAHEGKLRGTTEKGKYRCTTTNLQ